MMARGAGGMMADVVNLRQARKQKARAEDRRKADANAARFGLSKAQRNQIKAEADKAARDLEGHRRAPE
jgi:hypothetical protein